MKEKIDTFALAALAEEARTETGEMGAFGTFSTTDAFGNSVVLAFTASRYAYVGSSLCLTLWASDAAQNPMWEPYADLTRNVRPDGCKPDEIVVCTHAENAHLREPLLELGYFQDTGKRIKGNEVWRLNGAFVDAFTQVHEELECA